MKDGGGGGGNPYQEQTDINTHPAWLSGGEVLDVDLDGMSEYAKHMESAQRGLMERMGRLDLLMSMPQQAWEGQVLGEGAYARHLMAANASEVTEYLGKLAVGLMNIGMATQTIADIYRSTDGWSAASINAVRFAFGDKDVPRPGNLPPGIGRTYYDALIEQQNDPNAVPPVDSPQWRSGDSVMISPYQTQQVATTPDGRRRVVMVSTVGGQTITTMTLYASDGKVVRTTTATVSSTTSGGTTTVTTTNTTDGRPAGRSEQSTTAATARTPQSESRTDYDAENKPTGGVRTTTNSEGEQITETTDSGGEVVRRVAVGEQSEGVTGVPDSPAQQASRDLPGIYLN